MPTRAKRRCTTPGCPHTAHAGKSKCSSCRQRNTPPRPTRQQRGYTDEWLALSTAIRHQHPTCQTCGRRPSQHTDHIDGDPSNWARSNLQALCASCHSRKTAQQDGGFGHPRRQPNT